MNLKSILEEFCLFTNENEIFFFFYVNDIVFVYRKEKTKKIDFFIERLTNRYELKVLKSMTFFLEIRVIYDEKDNTISLMQDDYMNKLAKIYQINISIKSSIISLSIDELTVYDNEKDEIRIEIYRKKINFICYLVIITRFDIARTASKLAEFLINSRSKHLNVVSHCLRYLHNNKFFEIQYSTNENEE